MDTPDPVDAERRAGIGEAFEPILEAARLGQAWAFERLVDWLERPLVAYLRTSGADDPESLSSEVFLRVLTSVHGFAGTEGRFRSWVFAIAHNLLVDERRRRARRPAQVSLDAAEHVVGGGDPADDVVRELATERVVALVSELPSSQRDVLLLRIVGELSVSEVAVALGRSQGAVRALQRRALGRLQRDISSRGVQL